LNLLLEILISFLDLPIDGVLDDDDRGFLGKKLSPEEIKIAL
jgi:hypothetical protein